VNGTETSFDIVRYYVPALLVVATLPIAFLLGWLASLPGARARRRGHPSFRIIAALGWLSLIIPPLWFIAMVWAKRVPAWAAHRPRLMVPVTPCVPRNGLRHVRVAAPGPTFPVDRDKSAAKNIEPHQPRRRPSFSSIP
jgi:hypothetical protein